MAACHLRSISLPSRSHPLIESIEEQLYKLKASQSTSIGQNLSGLKNLFESVDDLLQLPTAQQTLFHENQSKCIETALNGSMELLDMCDTTRDLFLQMKECVQGLESSLRRRKGGDSSLTSEIDSYMTSRKKINKVISKCLKNLKRREKNCTTTTLENYLNVINILEEISLVVFESNLFFISQPKTRSGRSIISKLLQSKRISCKAEVEMNEMEKIDSELLILKSSKDIKPLQLQNLLKGLEALEAILQEAEEELEYMYRRLVKTRVSLLNILNY